MHNIFNNKAEIQSQHAKNKHLFIMFDNDKNCCSLLMYIFTQYHKHKNYITIFNHEFLEITTVKNMDLHNSETHLHNATMLKCCILSIRAGVANLIWPCAREANKAERERASGGDGGLRRTTTTLLRAQPRLRASWV